MKTQQSGKYSTDRLIVNCFERLVSDLVSSTALKGRMIDQIRLAILSFKKSGDASLLRVALDDVTLSYNLDPYTFKALVQIKMFLKRYKFCADSLTTKQIKQKTIDKFLETQVRVGRPLQLKSSSILVVKRARQIVKKVLGPYSIDEHVSLCRFSTKACVGFPTPKSYLYNKFNGPISGSYGHTAWFKSHVACNDFLLQDAEYALYDTLNYYQVPKSFKINRGITPNTLLGSYHSYGLGKMIEQRLMKIGINVSRQPEYHKTLAKESSITRKLVTADLSSASDSFSVALVNMLVPRQWFNELNRGRIHNIKIAGRTYSLQSFMAMGIGFTFPLQTLLFYALVKATQELLGRKGFCSVFGDDLVYPRWAHSYVVSVLNDCGFLLNVDKTFVEEYFRESCGGDFYHGIDVRPCQPEQVGMCLGKWQFISFIHKVVNGLTLRWNECEIPSTLYLLKKELLKFGPLMYIPDDLPDYSGIKRVSVDPVYFLPMRPVYSETKQCLLYTCLLETPAKHFVPTLVGYYWDTLQMLGRRQLTEVDSPIQSRGTYWLLQHEIPRELYGASREVLNSCSDVRTLRSAGIAIPRNYRSRVTHRRIRFSVPYVADKCMPATLIVKQAISIVAS